MKSIKSFLALLFISTSVFVSCVQTEVDPADLADSAYVDLTFLATAHDSTKADGKKGHGKLTEIEVTALPAAVKDYIAKTYAEAAIKHAGTSESGNFHVHVKLADGNSKHLKFDAKGAFLSEKAAGKNKGTKVDIASLPKSIADYIKANYATATIYKAFKSDAGNYGVVLKKTDDTKIILGFDNTGKFLNELSHAEGKKGKKIGK